MIYCYLRVSSLAQDEQNQRVGVLRKASELNVSIDKYYIDKVSGTTYGAGDGSSTFNLPNLIDKSPWHSGQYQYGQTTSGMIPNITGTMENIASRHPSNPSLSGAFYLTSGNGARTGDVYTSGAGIGFAASRVSSLYTNTGIVVPAALLIPGWIIKY